MLTAQGVCVWLLCVNKGLFLCLLHSVSVFAAPRMTRWTSSPAGLHGWSNEGSPRLSRDTIRLSPREVGASHRLRGETYGCDCPGVT